MSRLVQKYWMILLMGLLVLRVRVLLRLMNLPQVLAMLEPRSVRPGELAEIEALLYYIDRWLQLFPYNEKGNCFPRSLSLYRIARTAGYAVSFHCGVRKEGAILDGHAWLMLDNRPFQEVGRYWQLFTVTFSYPSVQTVASQRTAS